MSCINDHASPFKGIHGPGFNHCDEVVILGNGPSLAQVDFSRITASGIPVMATNRAWKIVGHPWKQPMEVLYYVVCDNDHIQELRGKKWTCTAAILFTSANDDPPDSIIHMRLRPMPWPVGGKPGWSDDILDGVQTGSVVHIALQCAAWLGFKKIYLLGVDLKPAPNKQAHFYEGRLMQANMLQSQTGLFAVAKKNLDRLQVDVFNLNPDSALNTFPKVDFDDVFIWRDS